MTMMIMFINWTFYKNELYEEFRDIGIFEWDEFNGDDATVERWWVTYFDEAGVEYTTKINQI